MTTARRDRAFRRSGALLAAAALIGSGLAFGTAAQAAEDEVYTQTFRPGPQTSFTIPEDATSVRLIVAGAQGNTRSIGMPELGGAGGTATVDLGTAYNGETLNLLVGNPGLVGGAGGSFVALDDEFLVVAGGGGLGGLVQNASRTPELPGGAGGFATASPDGGDGTNAPGYNHSGTGAVGATPGTTGYTTTQSAGVTNGTAASIVDGVIIPGLPSYHDSTEGRGGGQGYAGGAGGRDQLIPSAGGAIRSASGGGSGYLAEGLDLVSTAPNMGDGVRADAYVTVIWTTPVADTEQPGADGPDTDDPGTDEPGKDGDGSAPSRPQDGIVLPIVAG